MQVYRNRNMLLQLPYQQFGGIGFQETGHIFYSQQVRAFIFQLFS